MYLPQIVETWLKYRVFHKSVDNDHIIWLPSPACPIKKQGSYRAMKQTWLYLWDFKAILVCKELLQFVETELNYKIFYTIPQLKPFVAGFLAAMYPQVAGLHFKPVGQLQLCCNSLWFVRGVQSFDFVELCSLVAPFQIM